MLIKHVVKRPPLHLFLIIQLSKVQSPPNQKSLNPFLHHRAGTLQRSVIGRGDRVQVPNADAGLHDRLGDARRAARATEAPTGSGGEEHEAGIRQTSVSRASAQSALRGRGEDGVSYRTAASDRHSGSSFQADIHRGGGARIRPAGVEDGGVLQPHVDPSEKLEAAARHSKKTTEMHQVFT